jgi:LPXTG-site transpeptidase (sortase) family protein
MFSQNSFDELYTLIKIRAVPFLIVFFLVTFVSYGVLYAIDFIPEPIAEIKNEKEEVKSELKNEEVTEVKETLPLTVIESLPKKIIFDTLDREVAILNPETRDVATLDKALLSGVVRHPDSADFKNVGNIFILGHSSYLPNVINKNFQAFNGIQKLTWGDTIRLQSSDTEYTYRVDKVYKTMASEAVVGPTPGKAKLTLATCNSFGSKDDRFIVEASLIDSKKI